MPTVGQPSPIPSDWINAKSLGATGNGVTDDTTAIAAAMAMLNSSTQLTRGVVYLPPGTYRITRTVTVGPREGGTIVGHGASTTLLWGGVNSTGAVMMM